LFLVADPDEYPTLQVGSMVSVHICQIQEVSSEDAGMTDDEIFVHASGKIVRVEKEKPPKRSGFAVKFSDLDEDNKKRLVKLLSTGTKSKIQR
jgi:hypothetical protein